MLRRGKTTMKLERSREAEVMEVIKVPERRRNMWQTRPAKINFRQLRLRTDSLKTFLGQSGLWRSRGGNIHCGRKCEKKIKELCLSFWHNTDWGLNDLMCWLNIVFVWTISGNWCVKSTFINPSGSLKGAKVTRNKIYHRERAQSYHSFYFLWAVCVYTAARRCLKCGHHKVSARIYIMVEDIFGTMACYKQTSLLNIYAKLNERPVQRRNICASVERGRERKLRKDETHGVLVHSDKVTARTEKYRAHAAAKNKTQKLS